VGGWQEAKVVVREEEVEVEEEEEGVREEEVGMEKEKEVVREEGVGGKEEEAWRGVGLKPRGEVKGVVVEQSCWNRVLGCSRNPSPCLSLPVSRPHLS
jgi:hypothetical protein